MVDRDIKLLQNPVAKTILTEAANLHVSGLQNGFLSSLGPRFMSLIFEHGARSNHGVLIVVQKREKVVGFLLGTLHTGKFYQDFILRRGLRASVILVPKMFSFARIKGVIETLFYPTKNELADLPSSELMDIVISDTVQGEGIGSLLLLEFSRELSSGGVHEFKVTTGEELHDAARFYEKHGGELRGEIELHEGAKIKVYVCPTGADNHKEKADLET